MLRDRAVLDVLRLSASMRWTNRFIVIGICCCVHCVPVIATPNPDDIDFRLRLTQEKSVYQVGEPIGFELSFSSRSEGKYRGSFTTPSPAFGGTTLTLDPADGVFDLLRLRRNSGFAGSILSGTGYIGSTPVTQQGEVTEWYRFLKPGHYRLTATSSQVSRIKTSDEGGGIERLVLESNPVEFDILPRDPAWEAQLFAENVRILDSTAGVTDHIQALRSLVLLDSPAAAEKIAQLYLQLYVADSSTRNIAEVSEIDRGLLESSHLEVIIPLLEGALSNPTSNPPLHLPDVLADLKVRQRFGPLPEYATNPAKQGQWQKESKQRNLAHDEYASQANSQLLGSLKRRTGRARTEALYHIWYNAEMHHGHTLSPELVDQLGREVLNSANDLNADQQTGFLFSAWQIMPHEQLRPLIRLLAAQTPADPSSYPGEVYRLWCKEWLEECSAAILSDAVKPDSRVPAYLVLLMSESEHPEFNQQLKQQLSDEGVFRDSQAAQRTAALILRAGSRNLVPAVESVADQFSTKPGACQVESYLFAFLFRVAPEEAAKRVSVVLQDPRDFCASQFFRVFHQARFSDAMIPVAIHALDSPNLHAAGPAALFLAEHAGPSAQEALWQRLESFRKVWSDHPTDLRAAARAPFGNDEREQAAAFEQCLVSALTSAHNWKLSSTELSRLRAGCFTDQCRIIADGKMSLNL
jgi:hypothetical protein